MNNKISFGAHFQCTKIGEPLNPLGIQAVENARQTAFGFPGSDRIDFELHPGISGSPIVTAVAKYFPKSQDSKAFVTQSREVNLDNLHALAGFCHHIITMFGNAARRLEDSAKFF